MPFNGIRKIRVHKGYPAPRHPSLSWRSSLCRKAHVEGNHRTTVVLPKRKPLTQLRAPQWEHWLAASARVVRKPPSGQDPSLGSQHCTLAVLSRLKLLRPSDSQRALTGSRANTLHWESGAGMSPELLNLQRLKEDTCPFCVVYDISSHPHCRLQESEIPLLISGPGNIT